MLISVLTNTCQVTCCICACIERAQKHHAMGAYVYSHVMLLKRWNVEPAGMMHKPLQNSVVKRCYTHMIDAHAIGMHSTQTNAWVN